jgi:hypothetical protein
LGRRKILLIFVGLLLGMLLASLDQTIVSTALPTGWSPTQQSELADVLGRLAAGLLADPGENIPAGAPPAPALTPG